MNDEISSRSTAHHYLVQLAEHGIRHLYVNAGTDFAPLAEAYAANARGSNTPLPEPFLCPHEGLAVGMAHGAWLTSGDPQAVMFHVSVGTANSICAVANAARDNVPLLVSAGRSPVLESGKTGARDGMIHWAQEMFDQAGMLREFVKWDYELKYPHQVEQVVDRALGIAQTAPTGPVYLSLPREVLAEPMPDGLTAHPHMALPQPGLPDGDAVAELAARVADAECPIIVTSALGTDHAAVELLGALADQHGIGVADTWSRHLNLPFDHAMHLGVANQAMYEAADLILYIECDVPWISSHMRPRDDAFIAQAGVDPLFSRYPMRSHRSDLTISGTPSAVLSALADALSKYEVNVARRNRIGETAQESHNAVEALRQKELSRSGPITKAFMSAVIGNVLDADTAVFNEYWGVPPLLNRTVPGSYFFLPAAGGLGWALPAALGACHASGRPTVALVGDGAYIFANPAACHHASAKYDLPVLTVIANNAAWGAVDRATRGVYPHGEAAEQNDRRLADLGPNPAFEAYCTASGGYGEHVQERDEFEPALQRALHAIHHEGRQALLNVVCTD